MLNSSAKSLLTALEQKAVGTFLQRMKAILFGSRARGESHDDSDVDIVVVLKTYSLKNKEIVWDIATDIFLEYEVNISPLVMSAARLQELTVRERLLAKDIAHDWIEL